MIEIATHAASDTLFRPTGTAQLHVTSHGPSQSWENRSNEPASEALATVRQCDSEAGTPMKYGE